MIDAVGARSRVLRYDWYTPSGKHPCVNNYTDSSHTHTHPSPLFCTAGGLYYQPQNMRRPAQKNTRAHKISIEGRATKG
jgi:hypothetical protein